MTAARKCPEYRIAFKLHENGLTRDLLMDYGDFSMKGKLVDLSVFDSRRRPAIEVGRATFLGGQVSGKRRAASIVSSRRCPIARLSA